MSQAGVWGPVFPADEVASMKVECAWCWRMAAVGVGGSRSSGVRGSGCWRGSIRGRHEDFGLTPGKVGSSWRALSRVM